MGKGLDDYKGWRLKEVVAYEATVLDHYSFQRPTLTEIKDAINEVDAVGLNPDKWPDQMKDAFLTTKERREKRRLHIRKCQEHNEPLRLRCPSCLEIQLNAVSRKLEPLVKRLTHRLKEASTPFRTFKWNVESQSEIPIIKTEDAVSIVYEVYAHRQVIFPTPKNDKNKSQQD